MGTSKLNISNLLRAELQNAYSTSYGSSNMIERHDGLWIYEISGDSLFELKDLLKKVDGSYSLKSLAMSIVKGRL